MNIIITVNVNKQVVRQEHLINQNVSNIGRVSDDVELLASKFQKMLYSKLDASAVSILDLAEFKGLDVTVKARYKKYILDVLAPIMMDQINKSAKTVSDQDIAKMVYELAKELKKG